MDPDLLLLDEPTNHLDIGGISALEELLIKGPTLIVITHDRAFLDRVVTRIVELDRGLLRSYPGNFAAYETRKSEQLAAEEVMNRKFDKFWAQEEVWIRRGIEARRTRNEGRVRRLHALREQHPDGEILVEGPSVAGGGVLHTGDLGRLDERGRLIVLGRKVDTIVSGGENVMPAEVEAVLLAHPAVAEAGVFGRPDPEWGEAVVARVVLCPGRDRCPR